jgi:hypothetical protein
MWWNFQNIGMQRCHTDRPSCSPQHLQQPQVTSQVVTVKVLKVMTASEVNPMDFHLSPPQ